MTATRKKLSMFVVTAVAGALVLTSCGGGPGTGGVDNGDGTAPPYVGEWHFGPNGMVALQADAFTVTVGDGTTPLGTESPFNMVTKVVVKGALTVTGDTFTLAPDTDTVELKLVDPTQAAAIAPVVGAAIATAASAPGTFEVDDTTDPPTMTIVAPLIAALLELPQDQPLTACKDAECSTDNVNTCTTEVPLPTRSADLESATSIEAVTWTSPPTIKAGGLEATGILAEGATLFDPLAGDSPAFSVYFSYAAHTGVVELVPDRTADDECWDTTTFTPSGTFKLELGDDGDFTIEASSPGFMDVSDSELELRVWGTDADGNEALLSVVTIGTD